jgi:lysozyme
MSVLSWVASWTSPMSPTTKPAVKVAGGAVAVAAATWLAIATPFVGGFEGYAKRPYVDTVGTGHPITWCYGETAADGGKVPPMGTLFTKAECTASLQEKLTKVYDPMVRKCINAKYLTPHREAALVSFVYNLGPGALCNGPIGRYINAGNIAAGCNAMLAYDHAAGRRLAGLTARRQAEAAYCRRSD